GAADEQISQCDDAGGNSYRGSGVKVLVRLAADPMALDPLAISNWRCDMRRALAVPVTLLTLACNERPELRGDTEAWTIRDDPLLLFGWADADEPYLLHNGHVVAMFSDGRSAVANGGSQEIRIYGRDGAHVMTIGRAGDGPGEFRSLASVDVTAADSVVAFD